jgi:acyl-CoA thioester hydrolase
VSAPFAFEFRVRYAECDAQGIVFNARWGDYVDLVATEFTRDRFGSPDPAVTGIDYRVRRQVLEWRAPARFDDVLIAGVTTVAVGTTSFTLRTDFRRGDQPLVTVETVYVVVDPAGRKQPVPARHRALLLG